MARIVGKCPGCGDKDVELFEPRTVALVEAGQEAMTCQTCQESVTANIIEQVRRDPYKPKEQIEKEVARLRSRPAPAAEVPPAPAPQPKPEPKPAAKPEEKPAA